MILNRLVDSLTARPGSAFPYSESLIRYIKVLFSRAPILSQVLSALRIQGFTFEWRSVRLGNRWSFKWNKSQKGVQSQEHWGRFWKEEQLVQGFLSIVFQPEGIKYIEVFHCKRACHIQRYH